MTDTSETNRPSSAETGETAGAPQSPAPQSPARTHDQPLSQRVNNRSRQPANRAFREFIGSGWGPRPSGLPPLDDAAGWAAGRRAALGARFPGERLVIPAGTLVTRNNDCDYRFRPHSAFAHMAGTGTDFEPDAVLVLEPLTVPGQQLAEGQAAQQTDDALAEAASELRLVKDAWEIDQMQKAVDATKAGFDDLIRSIPRATGHWRGERVLEGAFGAKAREEGNGLGYDTIAAAGDHANTLHWITNDGPVRPGELVLVDAGVEVDSLYTADVTRTIPVDGRFTAPQRRVYEAVLEAADAAFVRANEPGCRFRDLHAAAMEVIARRLEEWGLLPEGVTAADSLGPEGQYHRRWMVHGTSHHLGLDVHDCAQARREMAMDAELAPGMIFTIEPGLYFRADDLRVPAELRGMGVRIEDDVVMREDGRAEYLTAAIPRRPDDVEAWVSGLIES